MLTNFHLQQRWAKGSFFSFSLFPLIRETPGAGIFPCFIAQTSYWKRLFLLQPKPCYRCGGRHPSSFPFLPQHVPAYLSPLSCCMGESVQCGLWSGQGFRGQAEISNHYIQKNPRMHGSCPTHTGNFRCCLSCFWWQSVRETSALPDFEPSFLYFSRWTKKIWTMFVLYYLLIHGFWWLGHHLAPYLYS